MGISSILFIERPTQICGFLFLKRSYQKTLYLVNQAPLSGFIPKKAAVEFGRSTTAGDEVSQRGFSILTPKTKPASTCDADRLLSKATCKEVYHA